MMTDYEVIEAFVAYLRGHGHPGLRVDRRPDKENRESHDIDAISGPFALEHTSIDTLPNQRQRDDWFERAVGGLEAELSSIPVCRLRITLEYNAVTVGQDWPAIRRALKNWIMNEALILAEGRSCFEDVAGVPFRIHVTKASHRPPRISLARHEPFDDTLPARIRDLFDRKAQKLSKYKCDWTTVLLVENADIALMSREKLIAAIHQAYRGGLPSDIDQLWYADTSIPDDIEFYDLTAKIGGGAALQPNPSEKASRSR